ncbi:alpha/beta hydrolase [Agreia sp. Leaf335]|uniref:alpha/beta fold hydrolase n=1 Tax=Agreia sp. Leaf335 TaxID=1736340 RepID=UPI0006F660F4|nr:alpha/beta hydrolase [Agreia sp. Leaf335]KQR19032.1 alpha/beta hydrolase [Agreia sp. Leaf335]
MRKPLKITLLTIGALLAIPIVTLATTSIVNVVATKSDLAAIAPYGTLVPVEGKQLNVLDSGGSGEAIVLLPGLGTAAPGLDFGPLIDQLEGSYRVIAVEPFGTGLSDQTDSPRTSQNIAHEVHEALQYLGIDRYVLMGHSIAGIYALSYAADYADELIAFVGIDSSVPNQPGWDEPIATDGLVALRDLGVIRALSWISGDADHAPFDDRTAEQMRLLTTRNSTSPTMLDEMAHASSNFGAARELAFPPTLPVLLFVVKNDAELDGWRELHDEQAAAVDHGQVVALDGQHYLHHSQSPAIADDTTAFLEALPAR